MEKMQESVNKDLEELNNKHIETNNTKVQTQSSADRITTSLSLAHQRQTNSTKNSAQISPYAKLTQTTGPNLGGQKPKEGKISTLRPGKRRPQTQ